MKLHRYVVMADRIRGFDALEDARAFAMLSPPAVVCERFACDDGSTELREIFRHDMLFDVATRTWRVMVG